MQTQDLTITCTPTKTDLVPLGSKTLEYCNVLFHIYHPNHDLHQFLECVTHINKISDWPLYIQKLIHKKEEQSSLNAIENIILFYLVYSVDSKVIAQLTKIQTKAIRLESLIAITAILHIIFCDNDVYCLNTHKSGVRDILDNWKWLEKNSINTCISFMNTIISQIETKIAIYDNAHDHHIWLTVFQKHLLCTYIDIRPYPNAKKVTFKHLLYLFVYDTAFIDSIKSFDNGSYIIQLKRYLYELTLWLRLINICIITLKTNSDLFSPQDIKGFTEILKTQSSTDVYLDKNVISKKMMSKVIFLLHEAMDHYTYYNIFLKKHSLIIKILQHVNTKTMK